jgi:hypothetical protein
MAVDEARTRSRRWAVEQARSRPITNFPKPLSHASGHCGRCPQRLMDANKIVVHREQRDGMRVVFDLLGSPLPYSKEPTTRR